MWEGPILAVMTDDVGWSAILNVCRQLIEICFLRRGSRGRIGLVAEFFGLTFLESKLSRCLLAWFSCGDLAF